MEMQAQSVLRLAAVVAAGFLLAGCNEERRRASAGSNEPIVESATGPVSKPGDPSAPPPGDPVDPVNPPPPNEAPRISGAAPAQATAGVPYAFRPSATDIDGNTLRFSISARPAWAVFDAASGELSGTPGDADVRSYSNIVISVSDGELTASLAPFGITVARAPTGSATVRWTAPTNRVDGTPLDDLAGFRVRYGQDPLNFTGNVPVPSPVVDSAVVEDLPRGTWYFAVIAYTAGGLESEPSATASKTIM
jgi:hypothetical protein